MVRGWLDPEMEELMLFTDTLFHQGNEQNSTLHQQLQLREERGCRPRWIREKHYKILSSTWLFLYFEKGGTTLRNE